MMHTILRAANRPRIFTRCTQIYSGARLLRFYRTGRAGYILPNTRHAPMIIMYSPRCPYSSTAWPDHIRITLPALSPTMETGTIVSWSKNVGDKVLEGDLLAEIETDKATMGLESPEDGYVAKIYLPQGSKNIPIGRLLCVMASNEEDIAAFDSYPEDASVTTETPIKSAPPTQKPTQTKAATPTPDGLPPHKRIDLPALSPTMETGTLIKWEKRVGDQVTEGDLLAEIETDKATMSFEASEDGYVAKLLVPDGTAGIPIGQLLCIIVENEKDIGAFENFKDSPVASKTPKPKGAAPAQVSSSPPSLSKPSMEKTVNVDASGIKPLAPVVKPDGTRVMATPMARTIALERGISLLDLPGSGPGGEIRAVDVLKASPTQTIQARPAAVEAGHGGYTDIPLSNMRKTIAKRLLISKTTVPHYYLTLEITTDAMATARRDLNAAAGGDGIKLSVNDFVVKAMALASKRVPQVNSSWMDEHIRQYDQVDVSVAVATDSGLITPIIFAADKKNLITISEETKDLAKRARAGKLQPHEFQGGTITVSNLGMFGISNFSAIINPPQACILAVSGTVAKVIPGKDGGYKTTNIMTVTLSCDHRVVDGAVGATWLQEFKKLIEQPHLMLLH